MKLALLTLALLCGSCLCWHELGHMLTARVAQYKLVELGLNPEAYDWAVSILEPLKDMAGEENYPFVECAGWADKLKSLKANEFDNWHFVDNVVIEDGFIPKNVVPDMSNITKKMAEAYSTLTATPKEYKGRGKAILGKSMMLRLAIHFFGDIHQPLHCAARFSKVHPEGDLGGNLAKVMFQGKMIDLHSVWDSLFMAVPEYESPLDTNTWGIMNKLTEQLFQKFGSSDSLAEINGLRYVSDFLTIAEESARWAREAVYDGMLEGEALTDVYVARGRELALKRVHQGGLRLAAFISNIYNVVQAKQAKAF